MIATLLGPAALERISGLPAEEATREAAAWLAELVVDVDFLESEVLPQFERPHEADGPTMAVLADGGNTFALRAFRWLVGSAAPIHDHGSWAVVSVVAGRLHEARFQRLDDGTRANDARLRRLRSYDLEPGQISILMPYAGGIHRIENRSTEPAISIHLYGPNFDLGARDFDPATVDDDR